jgi:hypothetical protein
VGLLHHRGRIDSVSEPAGYRLALLTSLRRTEDDSAGQIAQHLHKLNSCFVNLSLQAVNRATHSFELNVVMC